MNSQNPCDEFKLSKGDKEESWNPHEDKDQSSGGEGKPFEKEDASEEKSCGIFFDPLQA